MRSFFTLATILLLALFPLSLFAFSIPVKPTHFVSDFAGILSASQVADLENKVSNFEKSTTNEIAVVVIPSLDGPSAQAGDTIENVAQNIFTKWSIGKKDKNNGVLFLISQGDRERRIHTGYGVEGDLTDIGTSYIQNDVVVPAFKNGDYFGGINGGVDKIIEALGGNNIVPDGYSSVSKNSLSNIPFQFIIFIFFIVFQILFSVLGRSKSWWGGGVLGGVIALVVWHFFINSALLAIPVIIFFIGGGLFFDYMVSKAYTQKKSSGVFPWWFGGGGFGGGGFGGGGFGGFGGGMSGGGGSSSRW